VERAVEGAREPGQTVALILLESGAIDEDQLSRAVAERHGLDHVDLEQFEVDPEAAALISRSAALRYRALPIAFAADGAVIVAIEDPVDALAINDTAEMTRSEVRTVVASGSAIEALIERLPCLDEGGRARRDSSMLADSAVPPPAPTSATTHRRLRLTISGLRRQRSTPSSLPSAPRGRRRRRSWPPSAQLVPHSSARARKLRLRSKRSAGSLSEPEALSQSWVPSSSEPRHVRASSSCESVSSRMPIVAPRRRGTHWRS
jgi:hypothetical protein